MIQLNANLLELLEVDPQKFQQDFMKPQFLLTPSDQVENHKDIEKFQMVLQQLFMGLPVEPLLQPYPEIADWVDQLLPIISVPSHTKQVNALRQQLIQRALIVAQYDLLLLDYEKAIAINLPSSCNIPPARHLENTWKTQLQLFLLAQTEEIPPGNISLIYCFFHWGKSPTLYQFSYTQEKYDVFNLRLEMALSNLPIALVNDSEDSFASPIAPVEINLQKFLDGEMTTYEYLESIPEVEM